MNYQQQTLAVMNGLELVVTLYDGVIRFLYRAIANVEAGDAAARRESVRRVLEILIYLQARLRSDIGGEPAAALTEFYAAMYAQCIRASRDASIPLFEQSIRDVMNVREAWKQVASSGFVGISASGHSVLNGICSLPQKRSAAEDQFGLRSDAQESRSQYWSA